MAKPPIELEWGGGKWPGGPRKRVGRLVRESLSLAMDGLDYLSLGFEDSKVVTVWGVPNDWESRGECLDATNFYLYIPEESIKRSQKLRRLYYPLASTALHELTHCIREERGFHVDLAERAVGEGISSWSEYLVASQLLSGSELERMRALLIGENDQTDWGSLMDDFMFDYAYELAADDPFSKEVGSLHDAWFVSDGITAGCKIGIRAVGQLIDAGATISELVHAPAEDILSIDV